MCSMPLFCGSEHIQESGLSLSRLHHIVEATAPVNVKNKKEKQSLDPLWTVGYSKFSLHKICCSLSLQLQAEVAYTLTKKEDISLLYFTICIILCEARGLTNEHIIIRRARAVPLTLCITLTSTVFCIECIDLYLLTQGRAGKWIGEKVEGR